MNELIFIVLFSIEMNNDWCLKVTTQIRNTLNRGKKKKKNLSNNVIPRLVLASYIFLFFLLSIGKLGEGRLRFEKTSFFIANLLVLPITFERQAKPVKAWTEM